MFSYHLTSPYISLPNKKTTYRITGSQRTLCHLVTLRNVGAGWGWGVGATGGVGESSGQYEAQRKGGVEQNLQVPSPTPGPVLWQQIL